MQIHWTSLFPFLSFLSLKPCMIQSDLVTVLLYDVDLRDVLCTILPEDCFMYNINLGTTTTTILSISGVTIPIDLVNRATDFIRRRVVLFKPITIPTSDPKSEFLCQLSLSCAELEDPPEPPHMPGRSPTPSSPCITHIATVLVLSLSTLRLSYALSVLNILVAVL